MLASTQPWRISDLGSLPINRKTQHLHPRARDQIKREAKMASRPALWAKKAARIRITTLALHRNQVVERHASLDRSSLTRKANILRKPMLCVDRLPSRR